VVVLGDVGPNFGAGMTGGRAMLLDLPGLEERLNADSVAVRAPDEGELRQLQELLAAHSAEGSTLASKLLTDWRPDGFVVVEPRLAAAERTQPATEAVALAR
jgi:glutamate synthase (NADPH/NADH) large chain